MVRGVVRHVALDLVERPKHADEGEDLQLAHRRCPSSARHVRDEAAVREKRLLAHSFGDANELVARRSRGTWPS